MPAPRRVIAPDGVELALFVDGPDPAPDVPVVAAVHGYPDDHTVWDRVVAALAPTMTVVRHDVRGSGASQAPDSREAYRIEHLVGDIVAVLDAVAPGRAVHLLGHDWGSVQAWDALTEPRLDGRIAGFTSISGPSLDQAGCWIRDVRNHPVASARQVLHSYYAMAFQLPGLPELAIRAGFVERAAGRRSRDDQRHGLELYRANGGRLLRPCPKRIDVPVQVIAPREDSFVGPAVATEAPVPWVADLRTRVVPGAHWIVRKDPALVARALTEFTRRVTTRA